MKLTGENRSTGRKTCPIATMFTANPTWTDPGSNPGLRCQRPSTNRLSHGTAPKAPMLPPSYIKAISLCCHQVTLKQYHYAATKLH
jgi:hypothetical protein